MNRLLMSLAMVMSMGCVAAGARDLGAQIIEADAKLGARAGEIYVTASGTVSEGKVSLSVGHDLVCGSDGRTTISLNAGSYVYMHSHTRIRNCIISSTPTPILGEIQSINTNHVELEHVSFVGGGNLVYWAGVEHFSILSNTVVSITAVDRTTGTVESGFFLVNCSFGRIDNLKASNFVFPAGSNSTGILGLNLSNNITVSNIGISGVDASYVKHGAGGLVIAGSSHIMVNGGVISGNANMDGILSQLYQKTPSYDVSITDTNSSYNGGMGRNHVHGALGDGLDLINTGHIYVSNCVLRGAGYLDDQQPGIWIFIDDDVVVEDSDISDGSAAGIAMAGSTNVRLISDSINRNQGTGVLAEWQAGTATNLGSEVTFVSGVSGGFGLAWVPGTPFVLDGIAYKIASVADSGHLILANSPADHSSPVHWAVNSTLEILGGVIDDNGLGKFGGQNQVGISLANGTTGQILGVTATDTGTGTQLYGLELANTASVFLYGDNFSGNVEGGSGVLGLSQLISPKILLFQNQGVATTSSAQTLTLTAGAVAVQNLQVRASGDFRETDECGTGLPAFGTCQVHVSFLPTTTGARNGTLTITDSAPNSPQTGVLTGTGIPHGLGLSIAPGGSNSMTVAAGTAAKYSLSIGGAGLSGTASLSCSGAPTGAICNLPATEAISPTSATVFAASVTTTSHQMGELRPNGFSPLPWMWAVAMLGGVVLPRGKRKERSVPDISPCFCCYYSVRAVVATKRHRGGTL